jgi:50S ribosomal subunit-associated GTPase HflX
LVADGTRPDTIANAEVLQARAAATVGSVPYLLLLNKVDLGQHWRVGPEELDRLRALNWSVITTSAKTGQGVENAFATLAQKIMGN